MYDTNGKKLTVYSPDRVSGGYSVISAAVTKEVDKAGELTFTIAAAHPLYSSFRKIVTRIEVRREGKIFRYGRVYSIRRDFNMNKTITCEGALTFLEDICLMPFHYYRKTNTRPGENYVLEKKSKWEYLTDIMAVYNTRCAVSGRLTFFSNVMDELFLEEDIDGTSAYNTVLAEIREKIIEDHDYVLIVTYGEDEETGDVLSCLNIVRLPLYQGKQGIGFGKNLIDFEEYLCANDVYNCIVPIGSGNISIFNDNGADEERHLPLKDRVYWVPGGTEPDADGFIDKAVNFSSIDDRDRLYRAAQTLLRQGGGMASAQFKIGAVDLALLDVDAAPIDIGQNIRVISPPYKIDEFFVCCKAEIDLLDPSSSAYTFRLPLPVSPETMTEHLCGTIADMDKKPGTKLTENKSYGVVNLSHDGSCFSVSEKLPVKETDEYGKTKIPITPAHTGPVHAPIRRCPAFFGKAGQGGQGKRQESAGFLRRICPDHYRRGRGQRKA